MRTAALSLMVLALAVTPLYDCPPVGGSAPFSTCFRYHAGPLPTTLLEIVLLVAVAAGLLAGWRELPWRNPYTWPALVILAGATLDTIFTADHRAALGLWKAYFVEPMAAGLIIAWLARNRRNASLLLAGLRLAGLIVAGFDYAASYVQFSHHVDLVSRPAEALYRTPNAVALFLVPLQAFSLAIALYGEKGRDRRHSIGFLVLTLPAVLLSFSRGGWLALLGAFVAVGLFHRRRLLLVGVPALLAVLAAGLLPPIRRRLLTELQPGPLNTVTSREALWRSTLRMLEHRPLFGGGLSGFPTAVQPYRDPDFTESLVDPHNLVLNWWSETGLVGLAGFVWTAVQMVRTALRGLTGTPWARALSIGSIGVLVAILLHGLVDVPYFKNDLSVEFWALLGIQLGATMEPAQRR